MRKHFYLLSISIFIFSLNFNLSAVDEVKIAELVSKLGASSFDERNKAASALLKIGEPAKRALEIAVESRDPEIRMRAKKILSDIKLGINPEWPEDLQQKMRGFDKLDQKEKETILDKLSAEPEKDSMGFLLRLVEKGNSPDVKMAMDRLLAMKEKEILWKTVLSLKEAPSNKYQAELLVKACEWSGKFPDLLKALASEHLDKNVKKKIVDKRIAIIDEYYEEKKYEKIEKEAAALAKVLPDNAILLYIQSDALAKLGKNYESVEIENKALDLNPESESAHYDVGTRLMQLGKYRLAEKEWKNILDIPPHDSVYDINAYLRLSEIYEKSKLYTKALDAIQTGVKKYKVAKEKNGSGMGMVGADKLDGKIQYLKKMATEKGDASGMQVVDKAAKKKTYLDCNLNITVKEGKHKEMAAELKKVARSMNLNVQPPGLKLLKKKVLKLKYDKEKQEFSVMLNNHPCSVAKNFELKQAIEKVAVIDQDVCNIYKIEKETGNVELFKSYEKDYTLTIKKGNGIQSWTESKIKVNDKAYQWDELAKGVPFDILPPNFKIELKGKTASGKEKTITHTIGPASKKK